MLCVTDVGVTPKNARTQYHVRSKIRLTLVTYHVEDKCFMSVPTRYERIIRYLTAEREYLELQEQIRNNVTGEVGVRDRMNPCELFDYGPGTGTCWSDGHYMCKECKHLSPDRPYRNDD
jgi:hypothetical protein